MEYGESVSLEWGWPCFEDLLLTASVLGFPQSESVVGVVLVEVKLSYVLEGVVYLVWVFFKIDDVL